MKTYVFTVLWLLVTVCAAQQAPKPAAGFQWGQDEPQKLDKPLAAYDEIVPQTELRSSAS